MSQHTHEERISRRVLLQAAVMLAHGFLESRVATAFMQVGGTGAPQPGDALLGLGARDAVARIRAGDVKAEAYMARLLEQYEKHRGLNVATAIDAARLLEAARAVDRSRTRGATLGRA